MAYFGHIQHYDILIGIGTLNTPNIHPMRKHLCYHRGMEKEFSTYLFTLEVTPLAINASYTSMPLYCTLVHSFHSKLPVQELISGVQQVFAHTSPITLTAVDHQAFGPRQVLVTLLEDSPELLELHNSLYTTLNQLGVNYTEAEWVGAGYKPHISDRNGQSFIDMSPLVSKAAYLIEVQFPLEGDQRFVRAKFDLA
jgi:hypothetical protein